MKSSVVTCLLRVTLAESCAMQSTSPPMMTLKLPKLVLTIEHHCSLVLGTSKVAPGVVDEEASGEVQYDSKE